MLNARRLTAGFVLVALSAIALVTATATSDTTSPGTDVSLAVTRMETPVDRTPQYMCTVTVTQPGTGQTLAAPRVQTVEGVEATVTTKTDSGIAVSFKVLVSTPRNVAYEVQVTRPGAAPERHRANVTLPG